jgi:hypothetical protein
MSHNCYNCKFKGFVGGSTHISCTVLRITGTDFKVELLEFMLATNQVDLIDTRTNEPHVQINEYGRKSGWANYPLDFDPIWIDKCSFYTEYEKPPI